MTHLPECPKSDTGIKAWMNVPEPYCICDRLRACEQRVLLSKPNIELSAVYGYEAGRADGLSAARDAVAAAPWDAENWIAHAQRAADLAAIDALRGES